VTRLQHVQEASEFELLPDGLMLFRQPAEATPESIGRFFDGVARLAVGSYRRLLVDVRAWKTIDAAGRRVVYERGGEVRRLTIAVVAATPLQRAMVTFAALATRIPVRCFGSISEATRWLKN
jgi:hypothetical protein